MFRTNVPHSFGLYHHTVFDKYICPKISYHISFIINRYKHLFLSSKTPHTEFYKQSILVDRLHIAKMQMLSHFKSGLLYFSQ